ncbi:MAG: response regulator [Tunicatimonas sp.]
MAKLLLIDDDDITNFTVDAILSRTPTVESYEIKNNGWDALEFLSVCHSQNQFPDLIFVDLNMPEMDGFEFIERYEATFWKHYQQTKVNVLSSSVSEKDRQRSLAYYCVSEYTYKPLTEAKLDNIVK